MDTEEEVLEKLSALVKRESGGDWLLFFRANADADGRMGLNGVIDVCVRAGVGSRWTVGMYGKAIMARIDANKDKKISEDEFLAVFTNEAAA